MAQSEIIGFEISDAYYNIHADGSRTFDRALTPEPERAYIKPGPDPSDLCPICLEPQAEEPWSGPCGHRFHWLCISRVLKHCIESKTTLKCPTCRETIIKTN
jgi:hypothetical protein